MRIELTPRLRMTADMVPVGARLADVGTDHAYLPAALILEGRIPFAIAADLRQGPLEQARATVREYGLTGKMAFRLCDGLTGIRPDEADAVVVAGMGGETIAAILAAAPWVRDQTVPLILQPMSSMPDLRAWLQANGFRIREERLACEGKTMYTAMLVTSGEMGPLAPAELWAGKNTGDPLRGEWLRRWICRIRRALDGMVQSREERTAIRRRELEKVLQGLLEMEEEWKQWQQ